jgi:subtilisin-like proprotein convertase family protein
MSQHLISAGRSFRPTLEALEDRLLLSSTLPTPSSIPATVGTALVAAGTQTTWSSVSAFPPHVLSARTINSSPGVLGGVQLTFSRQMRVSTVTPSTIHLTGPDARVVRITAVTVVPGTNSHTFRVSFAPQTQPGTYTLTVGPGIRDYEGNLAAVYRATYTIRPTTGGGGAVTPPTIQARTINSSPSVLRGVQVTFSRQMMVSTLNHTTIHLTGPGGRVVPISSVTAVAGTNSHTFNVSFAPQTQVGTYTLQVGPGIRDYQGNLAAVYRATYTVKATTTGNGTGTGTGTGATGQGTPIPAGGIAVAMMNVGSSVIISHLKVTVNITYPNDGNLTLRLQAPDGKIINLTSGQGQGGANFVNTTFDDSAAKNIFFAWPPYTGTFQPITPLSNFNGANALGLWKLWVVNSGSSRGTINSWSVTVN